MSKKTSPDLISIVAIGASAGGIQAAKELFSVLPTDTGMAYIYIQHMAADHESQLASVIASVTKMKVAEAENETLVEPDHVYIIPPDKTMAIEEGKLVLSLRENHGSIHMPIDHFMISLAAAQPDASVGIILSGADGDGTKGLKAIKTSGGITIVQDASAQFQSMPRSAMEEDVVDMVLAPKDIAKELVQISKRTPLLKKVIEQTGEETALAADEDLTAIIQLLKKSTGVDFTHYKMNTINRRIVRRMLLYKLESLADYAKYLRQHTNEVAALYQDLLINVTSFFRDPDTVEYLEKILLPRLLKVKAADDPIRIWITACSTGEEAYSMAMIFMEILGDERAGRAIQIFATDLSEPAINKARNGLYTRNDVANLSPKRLERFFTKTDSSYRIVKSVRDMCVFAPHNIFKDPPFSRIDIVSCCNLMIYLDLVLQKKVLATFHYALNNEGYLILGKSETISGSVQLFTQLEKKYRVYARKKDGTANVLFEMNHRFPEIDKAEALKAEKTLPKPANRNADIESTVNNILLNKYVPASVVVNQDLEILYFRGSTGLFLEPSPGRASLNLIKMARPGLAFELRNSVHKADKSGQPVKKTGLEFTINNMAHLVSIEVSPLKLEGEDRHFLVVFEQASAPDLSKLKSSYSKDKMVKQLEDELKSVKEDMRSIIEEKEAGYEELQSANEEIVSSNEELQSINEELQTSKEELESTNEELMTINAELQVRNEQLAEAYEYAETVFDTIREAILILDKNLRIKSVNKAFYQMFDMKDEYIEGLLIYELKNRQWNLPELRHLLEEVILQNTQLNDVSFTSVFPGVGEKTILINARKIFQKMHRRQLILMAIADVTAPLSP